MRPASAREAALRSAGAKAITWGVPLAFLRSETTLDGGRRMVVSGDWTLDGLRGQVRSLGGPLAAGAADPAATWDLAGVEALDAAGAALLWKAWQRRRPERLRVRPEHEALLERFEGLPREPPAPPPPDALRPLVVVGSGGLQAAGHVAGLVELLGRLVLDLGYLLRHPGRVPWREWSATLYRTGATALPITALVGFLIGIVVSYLSAQQLQTFGANVLIVDLLGISILRELGPLLSAILVAGRSGSAMTAQLGVMRVTQELDALSAFGVSQTLRLVLPKVLALSLALPLLVLWTDALALGGGMLAADLELGIGYPVFLRRLPEVVPIANLWIGLGKGAVFGLLIAVVACHFGLRIRPDTESLGAGTTSSVVTAITVVILADAVFAVAFSGVGLR